MKGVLFYAEYNGKGRPTGNCVAETVHWAHPHGPYAYIAVGHRPNADVTLSVVAQNFLTMCCRRVSEKHARKVHPKLFEKIDLDL